MLALLLAWGLFLSDIALPRARGYAELLKPGNSLLAVRDAAPFFMTLALAAAARWAGERPDRRRALWVAPTLAGKLPFGFNASGVAGCLTLLGLWSLHALIRDGLTCMAARTLAIGAAVLALSAITVLMIMTADRPAFYVNANFRGVSDYQFWYRAGVREYMLIYDPNRSVEAVFRSHGRRSVILIGLVAAGFTYLVWRNGSGGPRMLGAAFLLAATFGVSAASQLGGHFEMRYGVTAFSVTVWLFAVAALRAAYDLAACLAPLRACVLIAAVQAAA